MEYQKYRDEIIFLDSKRKKKDMINRSRILFMEFRNNMEKEEIIPSKTVENDEQMMTIEELTKDMMDTEIMGDEPKVSNHKKKKNKKRTKKANSKLPKEHDWVKYLQKGVWLPELSYIDYKAEDYLVFGIPQGRRVMILTKQNCTLVLSEEDVMSCQTKLSGGSNATLSGLNSCLDCIQDISNPKRFFVVDALMLVGQALAEMSLEVRQYFLDTHITSELSSITHTNQISIIRITPTPGDLASIKTLLTTHHPTPISHLLFAHRCSEYQTSSVNTELYLCRTPSSSCSCSSFPGCSGFLASSPNLYYVLLSLEVAGVGGLSPYLSSSDGLFRVPFPATLDPVPGLYAVRKGIAEHEPEWVVVHENNPRHNNVATSDDCQDAVMLAAKSRAWQDVQNEMSEWERENSMGN